MLWILCLMQYCVCSPGRNVTVSSKICVRSLNYGNDGYELVFGRMEKKDVGK